MLLDCDTGPVGGPDVASCPQQVRASGDASLHNVRYNPIRLEERGSVCVSFNTAYQSHLK